MESIKRIKEKTGITKKDLAEYLGISISTLSRWERGDNKPSNLALEKIKIMEEHLESNSLHILLEKSKKVSEVSNNRFEFKYGDITAESYLMPYISNGPQDQKHFYTWLIELQEHCNPKLDWKYYKKRLSLIERVDGENTAQFNLEKSKPNAKSWSANYATHGWHRYVGRFPSQLIRALINHFEVSESEVVLDPFSGSGTTAVECRLLGIPAIGIEISPLSALISKVKSKFKTDNTIILNLINELEEFYVSKWDSFLNNKSLNEIGYNEIIIREGNFIKEFTNYQNWFTKEALLGVSIIVEFISKQEDEYIREILMVALSSKMRSIGNVDVDVVRAEYSKYPRVNVDVLKLVKAQLVKMAKTISECTQSHQELIGDPESINIICNNVLDVDLEPNSISYIITSPPYGVESISYLRTHLLSFRTLESFLGIDPYSFGDGIIGSEFLDKDTFDITSLNVKKYSETFNDFFRFIEGELGGNKNYNRMIMMMKFFEDMYDLVEKFDVWLKKEGRIAFIIGNKKIGDFIIPTDKIMEEIFAAKGFVLETSVNHKLKSNNSNSKVPWQERVIENEYIMIFKREV